MQIFNVIWVVHICLCALLVFLVMLQQGKGADAGAITGGGSGDSIFGPGGAGNIMTKVTTMLAIVFMLTSILLVKQYNSASFKNAVKSETGDPLAGSVMEGTVAKTVETTEDSVTAETATEGEEVTVETEVVEVEVADKAAEAEVAAEGEKKDGETADKES